MNNNETRTVNNEIKPFKRDVYLIDKNEIEEEEYQVFYYTPDGYWDEIKFDEAPFLISRTRKKLKAGIFYEYDFKRTIFGAYIDGWKIKVSVEDVCKFEEPIRLATNKDWLKELEMLLAVKQMPESVLEIMQDKPKYEVIFDD